MQQITLLPGKEKPILRGHPWVFSGAVVSIPSCEKGTVASLYAADGRFLGRGFVNPDSDILIRLITSVDEPVEEVIVRKIKSAIQRRALLLNSKNTNAYRLINADGDGLSGLVVDYYASWLVVQISTAGMERFKPLIIETLQRELSLSGIYEKSHASARRREGLIDFQGYLLGKKEGPISILEEGIPFEVDIEEGQKTGFFLDQREMRKLVRDLSFGKKVLNCFAYTGGFSAYAYAGGASLVDSVDISAKACAQMERHLLGKEGRIIEADVFEWLETCTEKYDLIILDPPAFAKKKMDLTAATRAYRRLNRLGFEKLSPGGILLTSSCSAYMNETLFREAVLGGAGGRSFCVIGTHRLAMDHPLNPSFFEGDYLKSLLIQLVET